MLATPALLMVAEAPGGDLVLMLVACGDTPEPVAPVEVAAEPAPASAERRPGGAEVVKPAERDRERWGAARCNDGTPFAYTWRRGAEPTWVIHLSGGFFCDDARALCSERRPRLTTTVPEADGAGVRARGAGVLSPDPAVNRTFASAHQVDAHYCSSDLWLGDTVERRSTTGDPELGWYFSGRENVRVLLDALARLHGLDDEDDRTRVLVVGSSAGGAGVVGNLEAFRAALPRTAAAGRLKIVLDGSWVPDLPEDQPLPDAARWGPVHPGCDRDLRARGLDPRRCVVGKIWWPYVAATGVPVLVQISGVDQTQAPVFGIDTPEERQTWRARVRAELSALPWVYSGATAYHVVAAHESFASAGDGAPSFREVLDRFWSGAPSERVMFGYPD